MSWPWLTLGNSFAEYPSWIQWYEFTGAFGGSLWILGLNVLLFQAWKTYQKESRFDRPSLLRIAGLVVVPIALSLVMYFTHQEKGESIRVVVVQPNYEPHYQKFAVIEQLQLATFKQLSQLGLDQSTDYLLYPESCFGYVETDRMDRYPTFKDLKGFMEEFPGLQLVTGINAYHDFEPGDPQTRATRERTMPNGTEVRYEVYNAAIQISNETEEIPLYKKSKLVPGPEIFPFRELLFFLEPIVRRLDGTTAGVGTQPERSLFSGKAEVAPVICYESVFGEYFTEYIRKGANAIFIMTNDGWWDNTAGHRQHLHFASLRAIETRRAIARSANTGISALINQRGDILQPTLYNIPTAINGDLQLNEEITFYVRWGDIIARIGLFLSILLILNLIAKRLKKEKTVAE